MEIGRNFLGEQKFHRLLLMKCVFIGLFCFVLTPALRSQTFINLGTNNIAASTTGLNDSNASVTGTALGAGVSFDLTITATSVTTPSLTVSNHPQGIGVAGGSPVELDNRNNLDPNDDESLIFTLSNVVGLTAGESLRISGIDTRSGGAQAKQYTLFDGATTTSGSFTTSPTTITVPNLESLTLTAVGPTSGAALDSRFIIDRLLLTVVSDGGGESGSNDAATVTNSGINGSGHPFFTFDTEAGDSYEIHCSTDLDAWTPLQTLSGTGGSVTFTDEFTDPAVKTRKFYRAVTIQTPNGNLGNTTLTINQTWAQEPGGFNRTAAVQVPSGSGPHPVVIMLHGNGGNSSFISALDPHLSGAIRVAPNGYLTSWNIDAESSKAPDVDFIRDLIALVKSYDNVDAGRISIFGVSNGSGMTNRLLIELDGAAFQNAGCQVSQMITKMHHDNAFWFNSSGTNDYDEVIVPAPRRRIISINGDNDPLIPYFGGTSVVNTFLPAQESIHRFAQVMGETGPQIADGAGVHGNLTDADPTNDFSPVFVKYTYRNGQVVHYKLIGGDHGLRVGGDTTYAAEAKEITATFLLSE